VEKEKKEVDEMSKDEWRRDKQGKNGSEGS
jgi:hypothetical protein